MNHLSHWLLAIVAAVAVVLAGSNSAQAELVVTITDANNDTPVTLISSGNSLWTSFTIGVYTGEVGVVTTNYPGNAKQGTLTTTTVITEVDGTGTAPTLTINSGVCTDTTGTTLANFTAPTSASLQMKTDVTGNGSPLGPNAQIVGTSTSDGTTSAPVTVAVAPDSELSNLTTVTGQAITGYYTLQNTAVISGVVNGDNGESLSVATTMTAPEPSTLASALVALPFIGGIAWRGEHRGRPSC